MNFSAIRNVNEKLVFKLTIYTFIVSSLHESFLHVPNVDKERSSIGVYYINVYRHEMDSNHNLIKDLSDWISRLYNALPYDLQICSVLEFVSHVKNSRSEYNEPYFSTNPYFLEHPIDFRNTPQFGIVFNATRNRLDVTYIDEHLSVQKYEASSTNLFELVNKLHSVFVNQKERYENKSALDNL